MTNAFSIKYVGTSFNLGDGNGSIKFTDVDNDGAVEMHFFDSKDKDLGEIRSINIATFYDHKKYDQINIGYFANNAPNGAQNVEFKLGKDYESVLNQFETLKNDVNAQANKPQFELTFDRGSFGDRNGGDNVHYYAAPSETGNLFKEGGNFGISVQQEKNKVPGIHPSY